MKAIIPQRAIRWIDVILVVFFVASIGWMTYGNIQAGSEFWQLIISILLLSVPIGSFYFSIGLLAHAYEQKRDQGQLEPRIANALFLAPRIAGIAITVFVGLFSLDVFEANGSIWELLGGFLVHALPAIVLAILVALSWRREWIGSLAFLVAALFFLRFAVGNWENGIGMFLLFSGPMLMIAILFWVNWKWR